MMNIVTQKIEADRVHGFVRGKRMSFLYKQTVEPEDRDRINI